MILSVQGEARGHQALCLTEVASSILTRDEFPLPSPPKAWGLDVASPVVLEVC